MTLLVDPASQPSKFRTRNWTEKNDQSRETYNANSDIKFKSSMIRSNLYDYSDSYMQFQTQQELIQL